MSRLRNEGSGVHSQSSQSKGRGLKGFETGESTNCYRTDMASLAMGLDLRTWSAEG